MLGYKLLTKYFLELLLVASLSTYSVRAGGGSNTSIQNLPVTDWEQVNSNGFGDLHEQELSALETFNGYLYAGTFNVVDPLILFDGARIFRSPNGTTWTPVTQPGFQNPHDTAPPAITDFVVFNTRLYASTGWGGNPAQIWRSSTGTSWAPMVTAGFGDPDIHDIPALTVYNGAIYAGASSQVSGARIYRSSTGDSNTWALIAPAASTMAGAGVTGFTEFNSALYATVESEAPVQIWRTTNGTSWTSIMNNGFGDSNNIQTGGMAVFGGYLYVGVGNAVNGAQLWRTSNGTNWAQAITPAFGDANNKQVESVFVFQNQIYVSVMNVITGVEVWRSTDGSLWEQVNLDGFGDNHNTGSNRGAATADFLSQLYVGTSNALDGGELWRELNLNNPPTDISLSANSVAENQPINTVVGALSAVDPDAGSIFTFSLTCGVPGVDDASFNILGTNLRTSAMFDFETKSIYSICIRVTDQGGLFFDKNFAITVNNLNEAPTDIALSNSTVDENQPINTVVGTLTATDPDAGATFTFSLACAAPGGDDTSFNIIGVSLQTSAMFDFETKSVYNVCIRVMDQGGLFFDKNFVVNMNNVNEAPTNISLSNNTVDENQSVNTVVGALTATDPDSGSMFTFNLACAIAGTDDGTFNINGAELRTSAMFDFETQSVYNICVHVTDQGGLSFDKNFVVTVNDLPENTAPTDISLSNSTVDENQSVNTSIGLLTATDPDPGSTFTFGLACAFSGVDDGSFNIFGTELRTSAIFDFETKLTYNICVRVMDQDGLAFDKNFIITVNNLNEPPANIFLSNSSVDENQPGNTVVGTLTATDPDAGAAFTFSLACVAAGADDASFNINGIALQTSISFDFENQNTYEICIRVTDQDGLVFDKHFVIAVNDLEEIQNTPGSVTGGGNIELPQKKGTFGLVIRYAAGNENPVGNLTFMDHGSKLTLKASSFTLLYIDDQHALIIGFATVNGIRNTPFILEVYDYGSPGSTDVFMIQIPTLNGYSVGGVIAGGNIQISTP